MALLALISATAAVAAPAYTATPGPVHDPARFIVSYNGSAHVRTAYRSTPPNPGGRADRNTVTDSSSETWALRFSQRLVVPACAPGGAPDPCTTVATLTGARGPTSAVGRIHHTHKDGLFRYDDRAVRCTVRSKRAGLQPASIELRYDPVAAAIDVIAHDPMPSTLAALPGACPRQGDSLDLLLDNYFGPGFSFDPTYNPDRWFTSRIVAIPVAVLHNSSKIRIPVSLTAAGRPPKTCAVPHRSYEHCSTTGAWTGVVELRASG